AMGMKSRQLQGSVMSRRAPRGLLMRQVLLAAAVSLAVLAGRMATDLEQGPGFVTGGSANLMSAGRFARRRDRGDQAVSRASESDDMIIGSGSEESSIRWMSNILPNSKEVEASGEEGTTVMPLFPLGSLPYMPYTKHGLNIFEPRYRELYDKILFSGSRRFVVAVVDPETERFAETGVVFYLDDLKEVSEMTQDRVKYVCEHTVIGRVRIKSSTYLRPSPGIAYPAVFGCHLGVETVPVEDLDANEDNKGY
ncbi:unnamed protein product, partial [Polarella glacialis]